MLTGIKEPIRNVLFDLDGTLVNSSPGILTSLERTLTRHGIRPIVPLTQGLIGPPLAKTLAHICGVAEDAVGPMMNTFKADYDQTGFLDTLPYAGATDTLDTLVQRGIQLFIITNKRMEPTRNILAHLGWESRFTGIFTLDTMSPSVTDKPTMVREILRREKLDASQTVFVGDSDEDTRAALENDMRFFAAVWGYGGMTQADRQEDWTRLANLADLLDHLQE